MRALSYEFPNTSTKLKEHLLPSKNLLNIISGTEEVGNVLTQTNFFPLQKDIKDKIDEYNSVPEKSLSTKNTFYTIKATLIWILS